eukprot:357196_1
MIRKTATDGYAKQMRLHFNGFFLSNSARNKKYDGDKAAFDFSEIKDALKNRSLDQLLESESGPLVLIGAVITFIIVLYLVIAGCTRSYLLNYELPINETNEYNDALIIEIEEVLTKLMELRKNGNMNDYEAFLQPTMQKYCLDHLETSYLDIASLESFHMNLAETVSFLSSGGIFTEHQSLMVTRSGGIIDPSSPKNAGHAYKVESCPLLTALYELGASRSKDVSKNTEVQVDSDSDEKFNQQFSWQNMAEFLDLIFKTITTPGECLRIAKELQRENMKSFVLNFYEMAEIIGKETAKEEADGVENLGSYSADRDSANYRKYVIGRDGGVYETDRYDGTGDEYLHCDGIERKDRES